MSKEEEEAKKAAEAQAAAEKAARGGVSEKDQAEFARKMLAEKAKVNDKVYKINKEQALAQQKQAKKIQAEAGKGKKVKLRALINLSGKYHLPYSAGNEFSINEKQARELLDNRDAEKV